MNILLYTQVGHMGGSFTMLLNIAKSLSRRHRITLSAPGVSEEWQGRLAHHPDVALVNAADLAGQLDTFEVGLFHLPFCMDDIGRTPLPRKALVVMEIVSLHPLPFKEGELAGFHKALYTHDEHLAHLAAFLPSERCHRLKVVNNIDFDLPFRKTGNIASIGAAAYKHNLDHVRVLLARTQSVNEYLVFSTQGAEPGLGQAPGIAALQHRGIEWDIQKLYSSFDCLFHVPQHGNGTSIVVSDALACGRTVVLSSLDAYREAYSGLTGVWFAEDLGYDLSGVMTDYDEEMHARIKADYRREYEREAVLQAWEAAIVG